MTDTGQLNSTLRHSSGGKLTPFCAGELYFHQSCIFIYVSVSLLKLAYMDHPFVRVCQ